MTAAPANERQRINLLNLSREKLAAFCEEMGESRFRAQQILKWVYHQGITDFQQMTNLSKVLRSHLEDVFEFRPPTIHTEKRSTDGTVKWVMSVDGGNAIETVFIPEPNRGTLCVSSQVGCALNCSFCSTATQGFNRNLTTAEIIGQVYIAAKALGQTQRDRKITNVVMMGMGEPLMNFEALIDALSLMRDDLAFGLAARRVTVSTAGLVPKIRELRESVDVALAISLHAPYDALRNELVPLNKKYPIATLLDACRDYVAGTKNRITVEYTLIDGVNDSAGHARSLVRLLHTIPSKLNLIPFNPFPGTQYRRSSESAIARFKKIVMDAGFIATVRRTRGDDIDAACGQLVGQVRDRTRRQERFRARLESLPVAAVGERT